MDSDMQTLAEMQLEIAAFAAAHGMTSNPSVRLLDLLSELGELSKECLKGTNYGAVGFIKTPHWEEELGDLFFSLLCIANETNTDLQESLKRVQQKYRTRLAQRGDPGSGR